MYSNGLINNLKHEHKTQDRWFEVFQSKFFLISIINFLQGYDSPLSYKFNFYFPVSQIHDRYKGDQIKLV